MNILGLGEREVVSGKPHFGIWFGQYVIVHGELWGNEDVSVGIVEKLRHSMVSKTPEGCETRHEQVIMKPPNLDDPLNYNGSIGAKYMIWGRAYKIMRLLKKGTKRYAKKTVCGRRKRVRIDRSKTCAQNAK